MKIEAIVGYPHDYRMGVASIDPSIIGLHHQIVYLMERSKDIHTTQPLHIQVWCTNFQGNHVTKCPRLQSAGPSTGPMGPPFPRPKPIVGVEKVFMGVNYQDIPSSMLYPIIKVCLLMNIVIFVALMDMHLVFVLFCISIPMFQTICFLSFLGLKFTIQISVEVWMIYLITLIGLHFRLMKFIEDEEEVV